MAKANGAAASKQPKAAEGNAESLATLRVTGFAGIIMALLIAVAIGGWIPDIESTQTLLKSPVDWRWKLDVGRALLTSHSCCAALGRLTDSVDLPQSAGYDNFTASWWSVHQGDVRPACVLKPKDKIEVAKSLLLLVAGDKRYGAGSCDFAVRGGGHTPFKGASNIHEGITIDLRSLHSAVVAEDRQTVRIGPGAVWGDVYTSLGDQGLATSGGRVFSVGVGGLTTGGGISFFSPRYGFVANNVVRFEVVLASGLIVNASETENMDLWQALKGGSGNFGIVTEFEMKAFPQQEFWGGQVVQNITTVPQQAKMFANFANDPKFDPYAALIHSYVLAPSHGGWFVSNFMQYTKSGAPTSDPKPFKSFLKVPSLMNTIRTSSLADKAKELEASNPNGFRQVFVTSTYKADAKMVEIVYEIAKAAVKEAEDAPGLVFALTYQAIPSVFTEKAASSGGDSLGLGGSGPLMNVLLSISWALEADDDRVYKAARTTFEKSDAVAKERGLYHDYKYLNYAAPWQEPIRGYGKESVERLWAASKKYDPEQVFQRQKPGGFHLPPQQQQQHQA